MTFVAKYLLMRFLWIVAGPFLLILAAAGVCWAIDVLDRMGWLTP